MSLLAGLEPLPESDLENQRVFVRADLDLAPKGGPLDEDRLRALVPTCHALLERGAKVILGGRLGDGRGPAKSDLGRNAPSLENVGAKLAELTGLEVVLPDSCTGDAVKKVVTSLRPKQLCLLENLASEGDTGEGSEAFARELLRYVDVYVGDSLRALGAESATTTILPKLVERRYLGIGLERELRALARLRSAVDRPRLLVWGGRLADRLPLLQRLAAHSERVFFVGVAANTLLQARGQDLGKSVVETDALALGRTVLDQLGNKVLLPADLVTSTGPKDPNTRVEIPGSLGADSSSLDVGPKTVEALTREIGRAGATLLVGTVGFFRTPEFSRGTRAVFEAMADSPGFTVVAGDDSVAAAETVPPDVRARLDALSFGGDASLALLSENKLPGLEALRGNIPHDDPN